MPEKPDYTVLGIQQLLGHGEADQGQQLGIQAVDRNGQKFVLLIPHELEGDFFLRLQGASQTAAKKRASHPSTELALGIRVVGTEMLKEGDDVLLRCRLSNGMKLDLSLDQSTRDQMAKILHDAEGLPPQNGPQDLH